jgi:lipopolysaccharide transport system ATP-binding protein
MSDIVIRTEGLSKLYRIREGERYQALRDVLEQSLTAPFRRLRHTAGGTREPKDGQVGSPAPISSIENYIWALRDVSFEVRSGEIVGIIGRNASGKSTLLKVLSRVTKPTLGHAEVRGRVGSLLDVGTGFHDELTGGENIYLNGAILGMRKAEIDRKFEEIVAFGEVEKFIETPVKHYSSGMFLRLAFAVAAHLEPDILLLDEALAVGDANFQKKCLEKIRSVAKEGRTVLLVSHQIDHISRLCQRCIWLDAGSIRAVGPTSEVVSAYEMALASTQ